MGKQKAKSAKTTKPVREIGVVRAAISRLPASASPPPLLQLQKTIGNHAVQRLLRSGVIQAKLKVSQPGDKYEQEADRVAEQVLGMSEKSTARSAPTKPVADTITPFAPASAKTVTPEKTPLSSIVLTDQSPTVNAELASQIQALGGSGKQLPESLRTFFEPRFGVDFSQVRVHTGEPAAATANALNAQAYTIGRNVVFGAGKFAPEANSGKRLLAHELAHVVQQNRQLIDKKTQSEVIKYEQFLNQKSKILMRNGDSESQYEIPFFSIPMLGKFSVLGYVKFRYLWGSEYRIVFVGSKDFWGNILQTPDEEYSKFWLEGFLFAATNPSFPRSGDQCERRPNYNEILEFMLALYNAGTKLKLLPEGFIDIVPIELRAYLRELINKYQGEVLKVLSKEEIGVISREGIAALAQQGGEMVRPQMVGNAAKCATEAIINLIEMHVTKNDKGKWEAYQLITNAGIIIRETLDVHNAKFEGETIAALLIDFVLDITKLDMIVGVETALRRLGIVKEILNKLFQGIIQGTGEEPSMQGKVIFDKFRYFVSELKNENNALDADLANNAISAFNNGLSMK